MLPRIQSRAERAGATRRAIDTRHGRWKNRRKQSQQPSNVIDPIHSLAFSVQSNPGVYAVLIGSGVSRAAGIPTGWDVTLDLVRKLAAVEKEAPEPNPETWFRNKFGSEPDYSKLLDQLGKTQPDRQQILRGYWEPSDEERAAGEKEPTSAHHAIAALASRGFIKVIITTTLRQAHGARAV